MGGSHFWLYFTDPGPCLVWIAGHSFVYWGAKRAEDQPAGRQLGFPRAEVQVRWLGIRGLRWGRLLQELHFHIRLDRVPDVLLLHAGGNDLGAMTTRELLRDIKLDCLRIWASYPGILIVWSDMVARLQWRRARSVPGLNRARAKLNRSVGRFIARNGGLVVRHQDLEIADPALIGTDGVHLNPIGVDLWTLGIKDGIERAVQVWRDDHT